QAILDGAAKADQAPFMLDVTAHTHVYGRPAGAWAFDACMKIALATDGLWIGTRAELVAHALASPSLYVTAVAYLSCGLTEQIDRNRASSRLPSCVSSFPGFAEAWAREIATNGRCRGMAL